VFGLKEYFLEFSFIMRFQQPPVTELSLILIYLPAVLLLCLEQKDGSLEDHTRDFLDFLPSLSGPRVLVNN